MKQLIHFAFAALSIVAITAQSASAETSTGGCTNIGAGAAVPASLIEGPPICDTELSLEITLPGGGGTVTAGGSGCPSYIEIVPSYNPAVIKPGYNLAGSQKNFHKKATYECVACGFLWLFTCCEIDQPWQDTANFKTTYEDMPCKVIIPQAGDEQKPNGEGEGTDQSGGEGK